MCPSFLSEFPTTIVVRMRVCTDVFFPLSKRRLGGAGDTKSSSRRATPGSPEVTLQCARSFLSEFLTTIVVLMRVCTDVFFPLFKRRLGGAGDMKLSSRRATRSRMTLSPSPRRCTSQRQSASTSQTQWTSTRRFQPTSQVHRHRRSIDSPISSLCVCARVPFVF